MVTSLKTKISLIKELSKSGIVILVLISVLAGYLIGHPHETSFEWIRMLLTLGGVLFLASGSSALNQFQERKIDALMPRTAKRPLPSGRMTSRFALCFIGTTLSIGLLLLLKVSLDLFFLGMLAVFSYNILYTLWWKKYWAYGAVPGAIPGALPILMGHVAANRHLLNPAGFYLFFILFFWQMPHFWSLALRYQDDYQQGGFPILPVKLGKQITLHQIVVWCLAYLGIALLAPLFLPVTSLYLVLTLVISATVLYKLYVYIKNPESKEWLHFFLWVNFSLIFFLAAAALDLWKIHLERV